MADPLKTSRKIYDLLVSKTTAPPPAMRAWTGETWGPPDAAATVVLSHPGSLRAAFLPPSDLVAGEAYIYDDIDIEGDLVGMMSFAAQLDELRHSRLSVARLLRLLRRLPKESRRQEATRPGLKGRRHSTERDDSAVRYHYDTGNEFFELFLDPEMVYSCAYYLDPTESLEAAQLRKLDVICRKLQLQPGQRLLDVGCGWGALVLHAAANYGVTAVGITVSPAQAAEAMRRVTQAGLEDRITIEVRDYRDVTGEYDAIASVGMFEHVGREQLGVYFGTLNDRLVPGGVLLNHGITNRSRPSGFRLRRSRRTFVNTYVFPDGELLPIETSIGVAERAGFETRDVESLRAHYALTLRQWVANLERNHQAAVEVSNETTYRIWRMYMSGSVAAFELADISIYQVLLAKADRPWTFGRRWALPADDGSASG